MDKKCTACNHQRSKELFKKNGDWCNICENGVRIALRDYRIGKRYIIKVLKSSPVEQQKWSDWSQARFEDASMALPCPVDGTWSRSQSISMALQYEEYYAVLPRDHDPSAGQVVRTTIQTNPFTKVSEMYNIVHCPNGPPNDKYKKIKIQSHDDEKQKDGTREENREPPPESQQEVNTAFKDNKTTSASETTAAPARSDSGRLATLSESNLKLLNENRGEPSLGNQPSKPAPPPTMNQVTHDIITPINNEDLNDTGSTAMTSHVKSIKNRIGELGLLYLEKSHIQALSQVEKDITHILAGFKKRTINAEFENALVALRRCAVDMRLGFIDLTKDTFTMNKYKQTGEKAVESYKFAVETIKKIDDSPQLVDDGPESFGCTPWGNQMGNKILQAMFEENMTSMDPPLGLLHATMNASQTKPSADDQNDPSPTIPGLPSHAQFWIDNISPSVCNSAWNTMNTVMNSTIWNKLKDWNQKDDNKSVPDIPVELVRFAVRTLNYNEQNPQVCVF